jgi:hypothetical protein
MRLKTFHDKTHDETITNALSMNAFRINVSYIHVGCITYIGCEKFRNIFGWLHFLGIFQKKS